MEFVYVRAEIMGTNASGQKQVHLLANNADGIRFWTDDKSIVEPAVVAENAKTDTIYRQAAIEEFQSNGSVFTYGVQTCNAIVSRINQIPPAKQCKGRWELLHERIYIAFDTQNMTTPRLAKLTGLSEASIERYVHLGYEPPASAVAKIAKALNVSADYLLGLTDERRTTGRWENRQRVYSELTIGTCSSCGLRVAVGKYCPNCGMKMEEDGNAATGI